MQSSPSDIKNRLLKALDKEYNVVDMAAVIEIITILERTPISKEALESTRLGKFVNELRRKTSSEPLARRAKDLVRRWRNMIARPAPDPAPPPPTNGRHAPSASPHLMGHTPLVSPRLSSHPLASPHLTGHTPLVSPRLSSHPLASPHLTGHTPLVSPRLSSHPLASPRLTGHTPLVSPRLSSHPLASPHLTGHTPLVSPRLSSHPLASPHLIGHSPLASPALSPPVSVHSDASSARRKPNTVDLDAVPRTHASNKRLRKASPDARPAKVARLNGVTAADVFGECSRDSFDASERSGSVVEIFPPQGEPKRRGRKKGSTREALAARARSEDIVKSSIASIARTPKVKTTRELMAGLGRAPPGPALPPFAARGAAEALEMSRNKTEHIARFLRSQTEFETLDVDDDSSDVKVLDADFRSVSRQDSPPTPTPGPDPSPAPGPFLALHEILAKLPPLPLDVDLSDGSEAWEPPPKGEVTADDLERLGSQRLAGVNGNRDDGARRDEMDDGFREWHESVSKESYRGELLHILPYVVID